MVTENIEDAEVVVAPAPSTEVGLLDINPRDAFKTPEAVKGALAMVVAKVADFRGDPSTAKGRQEIISMASKVTRSRTALDNAGLALTETWRHNISAVNAQRKLIDEILKPLARQIRQPVTDWEEAERARIASLEERLAQIDDARLTDASHPDAIKAQIDLIAAIAIDESWEDQTAQAAIQKEAVLKRLTSYHMTALELKRAADEAKAKAEADAAELERLRFEAAERARVEKARLVEEARRAREEAAAKAEAERAARIEREKQEAAALAAQAAQAAAEHKAAQELAKAKAETERVRLAAERAAQAALAQAAAERAAEAEARAVAERERQEREADETNRKRIFGEISQAIQDLIHRVDPAEVADLVTSSIMQGSLPHVEVRF